ncbi:dolichyl-diphosphooligosaccharide--protein glycosyltransferase subunit 1 [Marasmius crinis-equi]|uniref:Dolichyl-diphosphooligosaccharide--protein glycosyltransferase subunit 1 n=1 Tax=Marasmius crinis-equi TaxID=585013 RepID=A0ABR3FX15_9AGAR
MNWLREKLAAKVREEDAVEASKSAKRAAKAEGQRSVFEVAQQESKGTETDSTASQSTAVEAAPKRAKKPKHVKKAHSHKYSTAAFKISPRKLNMLGNQISGKPIDHAILQMQFSEKRASNRILNMLATARDHAVAYKGLEKPKLVVSEAWVTKGKYIKRLEPKGRGRVGIRVHPSARMHVVLKEGKTLEEKKAAERAYKLNRIVSASHCWRARTLLLLASAFPALSAALQSFENSGIVRTADLGGSLVHVTTTYAAKALEDNADSYTLAVPHEELLKTSFFEVKVKGQPKVLTVTYGGAAETNIHLLNVNLPKPLSINGTVNLVVESVQIHATRPWPERAAQDESQALKYDTQLLVLSPYNTTIQRTKLKSTNPNIISYTTPKKVEDFTLENPVTKSGATVTYGPYNNIPESISAEFVSKYQQQVSVNYAYDFPVIEVTKLKRSAEISHWGANLNIQDEIVLRNAGPELKGHFSRLQHQTQAYYNRAAAHVLPGLTLHLPAGIRNTYYYDLIGNVSTSRLRVAPSSVKLGSKAQTQYSVLELKPRFPLMGGWNYTFTLGWDAPLSDSASFDASTGKYSVEIPVMTEIPGSVVEDAEIVIVLPEGATDVEYEIPFAAVSNELTNHVTYLDTIGRPAIILKYKNLTHRHIKPIYVTYKVSLAAHLRKPVAVATVLLGLFGFTLVARRIDLTIHKKKA